jgi:hypothetical protein
VNPPRPARPREPAKQTATSQSNGGPEEASEFVKASRPTSFFSSVFFAILAMEVAVGERGATANQQEALRGIADQPFGEFLLLSSPRDWRATGSGGIYALGRLARAGFLASGLAIPRVPKQSASPKREVIG